MLQKCTKTIALILAAILLGTALLALVYSIPHEYIDPKVANAAKIIREEGGYPVMSPYATSALDNWTDSIMLLEAAFPTNGNPWENAMMVRRYETNCIPYEEFPLYYETGGYDHITEYPNYWHGYLVFLKPLLAVMEYGQIRFLNGILQTSLVLCICFLLWKRKRNLLIPYLLCIGLLMPTATARCMQFSSCFYVFNLSCLAVLLLRKRPQLRWYIFVCTGIATSYLDFLTYPVATFGMPVLLCLLMDDDKNPIVGIKKLLTCFLAWALGYAFMWLGKFAIGSLITGQNLFTASMDHVNHWIAPRPNANILYAYYFCVSNFARSPVMIIALVYSLVLCVFLFFANKKGLVELKSFFGQAIPYIILAALPFLYYTVMLNPTIVHGGLFGHKALIVTAFAIMAYLSTAVKNTKKQKC